MYSLKKVCEDIEDAEYNVNKMDVFDYGSFDNVDFPMEDHQTYNAVEISCPSTHIRFTLLTEVEHAKIKDVVEDILNKRLKDANTELDTFCRNRLNIEGKHGN